jgi:hypothetical protein
MAKKRNLPRKPPAKATGLTFETLVLSICAVDQELAAQANPAAVSTGLRKVEHPDREGTDLP